MPRPWPIFAALTMIAVLSGCDAAKESTATALLQPAGKKTIHCPQEWTLSDQTKLSGHLEVVETSDSSFGTMVLQRPAQPGPLKTLEFTFIDETTGQPHAEWLPAELRTEESGIETFRIPFSAPQGSRVVFRTQVGDQPETLAHWKLEIAE